MSNVPRFQDSPSKVKRETTETGMPAAVAYQPKVAVPTDYTPPEAPADLPPDLYSGQAMNLEVHPLPGGDPKKPIPGHELYWVPDDNDGIQIRRMQSTGWVLVKKDEVGLNAAPMSPGNTDVGDYVRRWSKGATPQGQPIYLYLMKKRDDWYQAHQLEREKRHQQLEGMILNHAGGSYNTVDKKHTPSVATSVHSEMLKPR